MRRYFSGCIFTRVRLTRGSNSHTCTLRVRTMDPASSTQTTNIHKYTTMALDRGSEIKENDKAG